MLVLPRGTVIEFAEANNACPARYVAKIKINNDDHIYEFRATEVIRDREHFEPWSKDILLPSHIPFNK